MVSRVNNHIMDLLEKYVVRSGRISWRMIDDQAFLLNEDGMKMHLLNKVGSLIWQSATGDFTIQEIIKKIAERFDIDKDTAQIDTTEFIERLEKLKILYLSEKPIEVQS